MSKIDIKENKGSIESIKKSDSSEEFEKYLKRQCLKTTFNGLDVEKFSWYRKKFGLI